MLFCSAYRAINNGNDNKNDKKTKTSVLKRSSENTQKTIKTRFIELLIYNYGRFHAFICV